MKILIVAPSWVGDTVLAQPLFKLLHARHAALVLDALALPWTQPLLTRMPEVRRVIPAPFAHGELKLGARRALGAQLRAESYDQAIVLPNSFKSALVPFFAGIRLRTGYRGELRWGLLNDVRVLDGRGTPTMAERFAALGEPRGAPRARPLPAPELRSDKDRRHATLQRLGLTPQPLVAVLCPGAEYGPAKRWPARHFAALARRLAGVGYQVWLIGSSRDAALGDEIRTLSAEACVNLCGKTGLDEAIELIATSAFAVSNDSGLMHVAAALGRPLVALYGSSSPAFTPPLSGRARILKLDLPCSPCFERVCPLGHFACMMELTPERVFNALAACRTSRSDGLLKAKPPEDLE
ncbi:MAG: lipopolysaccharide heptosyltransferase II [Betaproteobacteria bacterium]|nr:lipopolysaccharide heptosyltransferase II [Betaproteobacteria bacterium]